MNNGLHPLHVQERLYAENVNCGTGKRVRSQVVVVVMRFTVALLAAPIGQLPEGAFKFLLTSQFS